MSLQRKMKRRNDVLADGKVGRPKGLTRKKIINETILQLIEDGYFCKYRKSSEVASRINEKLPGHWSEITAKGTGHHLKRYDDLEYVSDSMRVKSWIAKKQKEELK